jgi:hypothetical protein
METMQRDLKKEHYSVVDVNTSNLKGAEPGVT